MHRKSQLEIHRQTEETALSLIVVADDDASIRTLIGALLMTDGHTIIEAADGAECMKKISQGGVDLAILDIFMPQMDGLESLTAITEQFPSTKVICISGGGARGNMDFLEMAQSLGAAAILHKPFTAISVITLVRQVLGY